MQSFTLALSQKKRGTPRKNPIGRDPIDPPEKTSIPPTKSLGGKKLSNPHKVKCLGGKKLQSPPKSNVWEGEKKIPIPPKSNVWEGQKLSNLVPQKTYEGQNLLENAPNKK